MKLIEFENRTEASVEAARLLRIALSRTLARESRAGLIVSGGATPKECFCALSRMPLPWNQIDVSLTDERCVPVSHEASNEKMIRTSLLKNYAAGASFLKVGDPDPSELAVSLVGMGEDGHFASIFPDNPDLEALIDEKATPGSSAVVTTNSEHRRVTLNLAYLLSGTKVILLIFGAAKRALVENPGQLPIAALLNQKQVPVEVVWSP